MTEKNWMVLLILAFAMVFSPALSANVVIQGESEHYSLNDELTYTLDPTGQMTLAGVVAKGEWLDKSGRVLNLGFTDSPVWVRTSVQIPETSSEQWYVVVPYPLLEEAELHILRDGGLPSVHRVTSEQVRQSRRHSNGYSISLPIPRGLTGNLDLLLRADSSTSLQVPVELWREDHLLDRYITQSLSWGAYFGLLSALIIYNLFLFLSIRDGAYGYYVLYLASLSFAMLSISGVGNTFIWPQSPTLTLYALPIGTGFLSLWALLFAREFLRWPGFSPRLNRSMKLAAGLATALIVYTLFDPFSGAQLAGLLGILVVTLLIAAGAGGLLAGIAIARYFVLAWTAFALGASVYLLNVFGFLPVNAITNNALAVGSAAEVLLLSFALAHRIKEERAHKISALQLQQDAERQVRELHLKSLEQAMHDSVTRMPNTSLLNHRLKETTQQDGRVALVLVHYPQVKEIASSMGYNLAEEMFRQLVNNFNHALAGPDSIICLETKGPSYLAIPDFGSIAFMMDLEEWDGRLEPFIEQVVGNHDVTVNSIRLPLFMNLHCGVAIYPEHGDTAEVLFQNASAARDSSARDKVTVQVYSEEISAFARRRLALMGALPQAIEAEELELYLQPQMNGTGQTLVGVEVLIRWNSARFGSVPAGEIVEIAENGGLMDLLSRFVIRQAWKTIKTLQEKNLNITCSINLSVQNLTNSSFTSHVLADAKQNAMPMDRLIFEVTETSMMHNIDAVVGSLLLIADAGCKVALDDFGTGYSSLAYLSRLPINELKIDRCFVSQMCTSKHNLSIVENTLKLAKTLNLETVAEGVEDAETLEMLHKLGCHRVQGYHFARPMPIGEFCEWALSR
ncbi:EAL domain-containing protein [Marinobacter confluentis]|uniref:EAL domain-containing protein n=1 Tax=Marinobacter confluentis TaxID=1697557 RepID=A0A4Z1C7T5_9GAMM|nr:EAL domain-containing protein [Marinobacter confluentis]TGN41700.1 EAL domain-containing protein [Marinobacter confluentis]